MHILVSNMCGAFETAERLEPFCAAVPIPYGLEFFMHVHLPDYMQKLREILPRQLALRCPTVKAADGKNMTAADMEHLLANDRRRANIFDTSHKVSLHGPMSVELWAEEQTPQYRQLREAYSQTFEFARQMGITSVVVHTNQAYIPEEDRPKVKQRLYSNLSEINREAMVFGVTLLLENLPHSAKGRPLFELEEYVQLLHRFPYCKAVLDTGHAHLEGWNLRKLVRRLGPRYIAEYHLSNNNGMKDQHKPLFDGTFDMAGFLKTAYRTTPDADFVIESGTGALMDDIRWLEAFAYAEDRLREERDRFLPPEPEDPTPRRGRGRPRIYKPEELAAMTVEERKEALAYQESRKPQGPRKQPSRRVRPLTAKEREQLREFGRIGENERVTPTEEEKRVLDLLESTLGPAVSSRVGEAIGVETPPKRGRGRPRKNPAPEAAAAGQTAGAVDASAPSPEPLAPSKRGRGRPRKNPAPEAAAAGQTAGAVDASAPSPEPLVPQTPPKRGRGRPRKNPLPEAAAAGAGESPSADQQEPYHKE